MTLAPYQHDWTAEFDEANPREPDPEPAAPPSVEDFWDARRSLAHIKAFARGRLVAPWAVLGATLTRVVAATEPNSQLPATIGSYGSLNLFVGLVGPPGTGKDAARKVAKEAVEIPKEHAGFLVAPLGSGEGLSHMFMRETKDGTEQHNRAALVTVGEIDTLTALAKRQSSTVKSQLRQAAMGEDLGFFYVDTSKRMMVPEHQYRMCLLAGIQPKRAGALLEDADGGTPQRFVWLPATDPDLPDDDQPCPEPMMWVPPAWHEYDGRQIGGMYRNVMAIPPHVSQIIKDAHRARARGRGDALDGHALFTRLKVAAALAILEGRGHVTNDDWDLSGVVMSVSDATREKCVKVLADEGRRNNVQQAEAEASRTIVVQERVSEASVQRVARTLRRALFKAGAEGRSGGELRRAVAGTDRQYLDAALTSLVMSGSITEQKSESRGQTGLRYRLVDSDG